jgi:hypothetical protein
VSDIAPKPIAAPSGVMPAMATAAPAATNTATAAEIPAAVANLSVGTFVTGTVIERNPRGLVVLRTDKGTIKLQTPVALKPGSTVTLQIQSTGAQVQLSILSIDGQPVANPGKPAAPETVPVRSQAAPANGPLSNTAVSDDGHDTTAIRQTAADRLTPERGMASRAAPPPQTTAPAVSFVARPLAQIGSAGWEALSSPTTATPGNSTMPAIPNPAIARTTITTAEVPVASQAQNATNIAAALPNQNSTIVAPDATSARATSPAVMPSTPTVIAPGARFAASFVSPSAPSIPTESTEPPTSQATSVTLPSSPVTVAAPMTGATSVTPPLPALPGDRVILRLLGMDTPTNPQGSTTQSTETAATAAAPRVTAGVSVPSGALTTIGTIVAGDEPPQSMASTPNTLGHAAANTSTAATVNAATPKTWIATPFGLLAAAGPAPGPVGTRLLLEVVLRDEPAARAPLPLSAAPSSPTASSLATDKSWPAIREIMTAVQTVAPDVAEHLANVTLPRVGPSLAAGMMAFVAAVRQGNPRDWLGDRTIDSLQHTGHGALIDKLADDFSAATRAATTTGPHGWQSLLMPLYDGDRLQQIRFYWQRQKRKADKPKNGTRFVVEAELTTLGVLQLDGIFDKPQFDLVVRTSTSLPAPIRNNIIEIFGDALLATSLKGAVSFQTNSGLRAGVLAGDEESHSEAGIGLIV